MKVQYSLDSVVMDVKLEFNYVHEIIKELAGGFGVSSKMTFRHWTTGKLSQFKENFAIEVGKGQSFFFGAGANWLPKSNFYCYCRLDFNPAKVADNVVFVYFHAMIVSRAIHIDFKKFDVAMDIPVPRLDVWLRKDQRKYQVLQSSKVRKTEYLGDRGAHGQVKLYNKQAESNLEVPLTRLEITMDYDLCAYAEFCRVFPQVNIMASDQVGMQELAMNGTDRVLVLACLDSPEYLQLLGRKMEKKIERIMQQYVLRLEPDEKLYKKILTRLLDFGKCEYGYARQLFEHYVSTQWEEDVNEEVRRSVFQNMPFDW